MQTIFQINNNNLHSLIRMCLDRASHKLWATGLLLKCYPGKILPIHHCPNSCRKPRLRHCQPSMVSLKMHGTIEEGLHPLA